MRAEVWGIIVNTGETSPGTTEDPRAETEAGGLVKRTLMWEAGPKLPEL